LIHKNAAILKNIIKQMGKLREDTVVIIVSNPVDIMTHLAASLIKLPKGQVFGSGTSLDTSRLRFNISDRFGVNLHNVHGYVLGEHGDSEFVAWSCTNVSGVKAKDLLSAKEMEDIERSTMRAAYEIIQRKQATYYGIGVVLAELVEDVLHDRKMIVPVSTEPGSAYNIPGISLGVPVVLGRRGVERVWKVPLLLTEQAKLEHSAEVLKGYLRKL
jgi:L-lactate dehydrogenase